MGTKRLLLAGLLTLAATGSGSGATAAPRPAEGASVIDPGLVNRHSSKPVLAGEGESREKAVPAQPGEPSPAAEQDAGSAAAAWGENYFGQLGTFYRDNYESNPVGVEGLTDITELVATSAFNLALLGNGTLVAWGGNGHGQLGNNEKKANWQDGVAHVVVEEEDPVTHQILGPLHDVHQIAAANEHSIVLLNNGTVMVWGNDEYGQLGDGVQGFERQTNVNQSLPRAVPGLTGIRQVAAGGGSDYALTARGTVLAWGSNTTGQLGLGEPGPDHCETPTAHFPHFEYCSEHPLPVMWVNPATKHTEELKEVAAVYAGQFAAYALLRDGHVVSWGGNHRGELGYSAETWRQTEFTPAEVKRAGGQPLTGVVEITPGFDFALARLADGEVLGWGDAGKGQLAGIAAPACGRELGPHKSPKPENRPCVPLATAIPALTHLHVQALAAGNGFGVALSAGAVYTWGSNQHGQLGHGQPPASTPGTETDSPTPTQVKGIGTAIGISAGFTHAVVLLKRGVTAPASLVKVVPEDLALNLSWRPETSNGAEDLAGERLLYRPFEHAGETERAEEGASESEEGPPVALAGEPAYITMEGQPIEEQLVVGERLNAEPGGWSGARPITFTYQWQRCNAQGGECANIPGATHFGYTISAQDVQQTLRALVTATGPTAPAAVEETLPTEVIAPEVEGEKGKAAATSVHLSGTVDAFTITRTIERLPLGKSGRMLEIPHPLSAIPYEVRFTSSRKPRVMVITPLG